MNKTLPKYIEHALKMRTKYINKAQDYGDIINRYAEKLGCLYDPQGAFVSDIRIYCEVDCMENNTRKCLLNALNKKED